MNEPKNEAAKTLEVIEGGKNKKLLELVPEGMSPKLYIDLIKEQIMVPGKDGKPRRDEDFLLFLYVCKRTGLDALTKQIHAVFRWDTRLGRETMSIQTGIDGMRLVAQRSGEYAGQDDVDFAPKDESTTYPIKASCTVYRLVKGTRVGFTATARWNEYVQKDKEGQPTRMWKQMPYNQLGKCAEALALRKAFPNELSGLYTDDEMAQTANPIGDLPKPNKDQPIEVVHGKPLEIGSVDASKQQSAVDTLPGPDEKKPEVKVVAPDLGAMRQAIAPEGKKL